MSLILERLSGLKHCALPDLLQCLARPALGRPGFSGCLSLVWAGALWADQILALREQLALLAEEPLRLL